MPCCSKLLLISLLSVACAVGPVYAQSDDEITPQSEAALDRGLAWLAKNQGPEGNWGCNDLRPDLMDAVRGDLATPGIGEVDRKDGHQAQHPQLRKR